jgi:hypothetical protein
MSLHSSSSAVTMHHPARGAVEKSSADPKLLIAMALFVAVLVADALLILAAAPNLADLGSLYISTT